MVASARALLERARGQGGHCYADQDFSPISELDVEILAHRFGARIRVAPLPDEIQELAVPGIAGPHTLRINRDLPPAFRRLAMRHGLAHVIAGELEGDHDGGEHGDHVGPGDEADQHGVVGGAHDADRRCRGRKNSTST